MENNSSPPGRLFRCAILASSLLIAASAFGQEAATAGSCVPPDAMKNALLDKPAVENYNNLGLWFAKQQKYACAADAFGSSLQLDTKQPDARHIIFLFGASLFYSGQTKDGIDALREAEALGYRDLKLHLLLAAAFEATHSVPDAIAEWRAALEMDPEYTPALDNLSQDLILGKDFAAVIKTLEAPRLLGQRTVQQALNLAEAYTRTHQPDQAARVLRDSLNTYPGSMELARALAGNLRQSGHADEADTVLKVAAEEQEAQKK